MSKIEKVYTIKHFYTRNLWLTELLSLCCPFVIWAASSKFGTYRLCKQRRFRRACASAQSRQNLRCSLIQAMSQEEPSDRKPDPWPLWMARHTQFKFIMTECSKTQIRLTGLIYALCSEANVCEDFYVICLNALSFFFFFQNTCISMYWRNKFSSIIIYFLHYWTISFSEILW